MAMNFAGDMPNPSPLSGASKRILAAIGPLILLVSSATVLWAGLSPASRAEVAGLVHRMEAAQALVGEYQAETEVHEYREGRLVETKQFLYTFKKPNHVRIDMESPYPGMILAYPDEEGKVAVKPGGWVGFLKLHLSPDSALLRSSAGQRISQTDQGLLIRNIVHSLTDRRRGEIRMADEEGRVFIEVLADDHFLDGVVTLYRIAVDKARWLTVEVEELTPDGVPKRKVIFRNVRTLRGVPDSFFRIDGGE